MDGTDFLKEQDRLLLETKRECRGFLFPAFASSEARLDAVRTLEMFEARGEKTLLQALSLSDLNRETYENWKDKSSVWHSREQSNRKKRDFLLGFAGKSGQSILLWVMTGFAIIISILFFDRDSIDAVRSTEHTLLYPFFLYITRLGESFYYIALPLIIAFICGAYSRSCGLRMIYISGSVLLSGLIVNILKPVFGRARPDIMLSKGIFGFYPFHFDVVGDGAHLYHSFPSGHSATAASVAIALTMIYPRGRYFFFLFAIIVSLSRVMVMRHYPSDIFSGMFIGFLAPLFLYRFMKPHQ